MIFNMIGNRFILVATVVLYVMVIHARKCIKLIQVKTRLL